MHKFKNSYDNQKTIEDETPGEESQKDRPLERRYPGPNRLPTKVNWDRLAAAAVGSPPSCRRRIRQRLIPIDNETRERIIGELREQGVID